MTKRETDLIAALERLMRSYPTDHDMYAAGWNQSQVDEACNAYDAARAALAEAKGDQCFPPGAA